MENPTNRTGKPDSEITLQEQDFEFIEAAGKWSRILSAILTFFLGLIVLLGSAAFLAINKSSRSIPRSSGSSSGFQITKKQYFDVDMGGYIFCLYACVFSGVLIYLIFRFSAAAKTASRHRQAADFTNAMMQLSWIFKLLVIGLSGGLGLLILGAVAGA